VFADFIADNIISNAKLKNSVKVLDPAVGDGELLISLIKALKSHSIYNIDVCGIDTNPVSIEITKKRLEEAYPEISLTLKTKDFLELCLEKETLFDSNKTSRFDLLISNPPYIRTQVLGSKQTQKLSKAFGLKGRIDIYQAFLIAMQSVLKKDAVAGVIVSNRFLTTKGAAKFRETLYHQYSIKGIWDFGDTKVFDAAVLPAVMVLSPCNKKDNVNIPFSSVYVAENHENTESAPFVDNQIKALQYSGIVRSKKANYRVKSGQLNFDSKPSDLWSLQDSDSKRWLNTVSKNTWCLFKDIGKVRVGVKTTADNIFIKSDWKSDIGYEPELLLPLSTHHIAGRYKNNKNQKKYILYTHTIVDGRRTTYNLEQYPLSKKYLEDNKKQLTARKYVAEANRHWFEIWVPQNPSLWSQPKIIFRDITERPTFWIDKEGTVVNGDCYWMVSDKRDAPKGILWLVLAIANSRFIEVFYDIKFQNKLYSKKRRFITQYVEQFPIPDPNLKESQKLITLAEKCYNEENIKNREKFENEIDQIVWSIFKVQNL
jgi:adenine-specific DNA-methyltransferase